MKIKSSYVKVYDEFFESRENFTEEKWATEAKITLTRGPFIERLAETLKKIKEEEQTLRRQIKAIEEGLHYLYMKGFVGDFHVEKDDNGWVVMIRVEVVGYDGDNYIIVI
jgi:hypothetical protein